MLSSELKARSQKLVKEQAEQAERTRRKAEAERIAKQRQQRRLAEAEEQARLQRLAALQRAEQERQQHEEDLEHNNGVYYSERLQPVPAEAGAGAWATGVKRSADKILLPPAAGRLLMDQDAPKNGAMFFELSSLGGRTHAGVLDFTAPAGTVVLPRKVMRSLWGPDATEPLAPVDVKYRRLEKGSYVRFQPRLADFQRDTGDAVGDALTAALLTHAALSEGDWVEVPLGDATYDLRVLELRPSPAVSVIDTEMAAEVEPSMETEERLAAEAEAAALRQARLEALRQEREAAAAEERRRADEEAQEASRRAAAEAEAAAQRAADSARRRQEKEASLPSEPDAGERGGVTLCAVRLPDGTRPARRFRQTDPLRLLFDFVDAKGAGGLHPGQYRLVAQFPRRVLLPGVGDDMTLGTAGLTAPQEALLVEPV